MQPETALHPVRVRGDLDPALSRWQWLVKWILAIPHYVVLFFLRIAYLLVTVIAFFAILFTGKYPRGLFDFNVGVMRWSWRVMFYALSALGTDKYPPFSLRSSAEYPADLEVDYPQHLHRGLVLIKWWLLAIPHYLILIAFFDGGMPWFMGDDDDDWGDGTILVPLIRVLLLIAVVALLFTARYPKGLYDFVIGINRWAIRVIAYASLMRDEYPPFRSTWAPVNPNARPVEPLIPALSVAARDAKGKFRFRLNAANGEIIAAGEAYDSKASAKNGIASVQKNAASATVVDLSEVSTSVLSRKQIYKITCPNGKIYVGMDLTATLLYMGSPKRQRADRHRPCPQSTKPSSESRLSSRRTSYADGVPGARRGRPGSSR